MDKFIKIPKFMVLFTLYLLLTWNFEFIGSSILMYYENVNAPILLLIIICVTLVLIGILKFSKVNLLLKIKENQVCQITTTLYLIISIIFSFFVLTIIFHNWFYTKTPIYILLLLFIGIIMLIHRNLRFIFYFGFYLGIIFLFFNFLPIFCANERTITFLNYIDFKFSKFWVIFASSYILLDVLVYLPLNNHFSNPIVKKDLLIVTICSGISALLMMFDNYLFLLPNTFSFYNQPALLKYRIYQLDPIGESLDFLIIIDVIYLLIIKNSLSLFLIKNYQELKSKSINYILILSLFFIATYVLIYMKSYRIVTIVIGVVLSILILIYYIFLSIIFWRSRKYEK